MTVPPGAITAALDAIKANTASEFRHKHGQAEKWHVVVALNAAAPLIAAAERDRIRQLAEEHNAVADPCYDEQPFADLLRVEP